MERHELSDRQLDAVLERLGRISAELQRLNARQEAREDLARISRELATLNETLQALAYAVLGRQEPQVRRRRSG
jgi:hypothetical protein